MQDRFKFRFYDNDKKIMIDENSDYATIKAIYGQDEWWWCVEAGMPTVLHYFEQQSWRSDRKFVIMQCTGLKDKNGKLVYEGDILGGIYGNLDIFYCPQCMQFELHAKGYGCMACNGDIHWYEVVEDNNKLEVIGNIYENADLLESEV